MKQSLRLVTVPLLAILVPLAGVTAQESYTLRYALHKGTIFVYEDIARTSVTQEMGGQEMKMSSVVTMLNRGVVQDVQENGAIVIIASLDTMLVASKSPRRDTTMLMTDLMGKRSKVVLSPMGKVLLREVIDSITSLGGMVRGASMREVLRFHQFPDTPVAVGGSWMAAIVDTNEAMGGKISSRADVVYRLDGVEEKGGRSCLRITYKGETTIEGKGAMMGMEIFMEGKGVMSGTVYFDPKGGLTVAEDGRVESDVTAAMTGEQTMTMPISQSTVLSRLLRSVEGGSK